MGAWQKLGELEQVGGGSGALPLVQMGGGMCMNLKKQLLPFHNKTSLSLGAPNACAPKSARTPHTWCPCPLALPPQLRTLTRSQGLSMVSGISSPLVGDRA